MASLQKKQFSTTKKVNLIHRTVKKSLLYVYMSFRVSICIDPTLCIFDHNYPILQKQLRGYKKVYPPTKHQKSILVKLVLHIYRKHNFHFITSTVKLVTWYFLLGMRSFKYSMTLKGETNKTWIFQKYIYTLLQEILQAHTHQQPCSPDGKGIPNVTGSEEYMLQWTSGG